MSKVSGEKGFLILETGEVYEGKWRGGQSRAGEVVFNTSHAGYEEMSTDPSYFSQILVLTAPMQGNYGADRACWESRRIWIEGFVSLEMQESAGNSSWRDQLDRSGVPVLSDLDTREIVLRLRDQGTPWGALLKAKSIEEAKLQARPLIEAAKLKEKDWVYLVSRRELEIRKGHLAHGPRVAVLDYGCKENTLRELAALTSEVAIFPSRTPERVIKDWNPAGIMLTNGPGDPSDVKESVQILQGLLGWKPVFGICMGNQILALALGAQTYKLKFGHRGGNHPVRDLLTDQIYMTSQNHGYAVDAKTLPTGARVSHVNLNDQTVEGIEFQAKKALSVQFHPESHPGPRDASNLFRYFLDSL